MAHLENYNKQQIKNVLHEHDRTAKDYKNNVDSSRTRLNYGYGACDKSADEIVLMAQARCDEITGGRKLQDHTNIISEWVTTYPADRCVHKDTGRKDKNGEPIYYNEPKDFDDCKRFFDVVYQFTCDRYGKDNVLAGYVHMDETTPQIHINLVPEATSRKSGKRTVSSASLFDKAELHNYHRDLEKTMQEEFGCKGMILNGRTKGDYTLEELKERTANEVRNARRRVNIEKDRKALEADRKALEADRKALEARENELSQREQEVSDILNREKPYLERLEAWYQKRIQNAKTLQEKERAENGYNSAQKDLQRNRVLRERYKVDIARCEDMEGAEDGEACQVTVR